MSNYIDGFVHTLPSASLEDYKQLVAPIAEIWKEHGALDYWECVGDDMHLEGVRSFIDLMAAKEEEVVLFGWVVFESREARDRANEKVATDPRMQELMGGSDTGFDAARMAYGGFKPFLPR